MKKIIVTGTSGFIGKKIYDRLKKISDVILLEINEDLFDYEKWYSELPKVLKKFNPDVIYHVGACSNTLETDVNYMMTRNYESTKIISDYCYENNVKLIYSSSAANYGTNKSFPSNLYGWSKYVAEDYVLNKGGVGLRYFNVYGLGEQHKGKMSSVAYQMMEKTEIGDDIKLFPDFPKRDFVYIEDVVSANLYAEENFEGLKGKYYEVGSGEARTFEDVLENIGITKFHYYDKSDIPEGYQFFTESNKNKWMKGWSPKYNLEDGLKDYKLKFKFRKNRRLWIFGDSFSQSFENLFTQDVEWSKQYKKYKKENVPKVYGQLISEKTELEIINHARGGVSNDYIFHCFIEKLNEVEPGDIFIFNWTEVTRFTLSNDHNELTTVIPFAHHDPPSKYVTEKTVNEIGVNRGEYSSYWQQVNNYMKIIKSTLVDHEVYFWTWVKYEDKTPSIVWSDIFKDKILCIKNWSKSNKKTKQLFEEESDYLLDMTKIKHVDEIYELKKKYRKLYVFNVDILSNKAKFTNFSDIIWLDAEDHFNTFKNNLIPTNNYETIKEETKNKIDDLHYSEQGQKDLSEDILNYIIKQKEKENNKLILQKDSEIGYKNTKTII